MSVATSTTARGDARPSSSANSTKSIIAAVVILICAVFLYARFVGFGPSFDLGEHKALGEAAAEEALKLTPNGHITLIARDTHTFENPAAEAQIAGFKRAMKRAGKAPGAIRLIKQNPLRVVALSANDFLEALRKEKDTDVIVSLLGPPVLDDARATKLGEKKPKVVALCSGWMPRYVDLRRLFEQGMLSVAIISRDVSAPAPKSDNPRERFESLFTVVTAANVSELPQLARSNP